jgi:multicomponent Na+:H+ antiporter subunit E
LNTRRLLWVAALSAWGFGVWVLLTWTLTLEQLLVGAMVAVLVAVATLPLGPVAGPWWFLTPRRLFATVRLIVITAVRIVAANVKLSIRIWRPSRPLQSGMIIVATHERTDGGVAAVGIISSLVVDNQIVDVDRRSRHLQYHAVSVPEGSRRAARNRVNGPVEDLLKTLEARDD